MGPLELAAFFLAVAFLPPLLFLLWIRQTERRERERVGPLLRVFLVGAVLAVVLAFALEVVLDYHLRDQYAGIRVWVPYAVFTAVVVAPVVEEGAKALAVLTNGDRRPEREDGLVYGAAAGLGFAATENLLYGGAAYALAGTEAYLATVAARTVAATLLHASASAWAGYGLLAWRNGHGSWVGAVLWLLFAVLLHGAYNLVASFGTVPGLVVAAAASLYAWHRVRRRVKVLDRAGA